jgi:hypothetical protein
LLEFARAIRASDNPDPELEYIVTSLNEWQVPRDRRAKIRDASVRSPDEAREGYSYRLFRWPAFVRVQTWDRHDCVQVIVLGWLLWLV